MSSDRTTSRSRSARHGARLIGVLAALAATMVLGVSTASAAQPARIGNTDVSLRDCYHPTKQPAPSQNCTLQATLPARTSVTLICQFQGQNIYGDVWWDYVNSPRGYGYVADYYVDTGQPAYRVPGVPLCSY